MILKHLLEGVTEKNRMNISKINDVYIAQATDKGSYLVTAILHKYMASIRREDSIGSTYQYTLILFMFISLAFIRSNASYTKS
jgi:hypothetical protein